MAVPKFFDFFPYVLAVLNESETLSTAQIRKAVIAEAHLTEEDLSVMLPSGKQRTVDNRINWAVTYLKKATLIHAVSRGKYAITDEGRKAYAEAGSSINLQYLEQYDSFRAFHNAKNNSGEFVAPQSDTSENTPQDTLDLAFSQINTELADDLLSAVMERSPQFFEKLVIDLLVRMGYGGAFDDAGQVVGQSGDEGIDGIIREDKLGFSNIYIQAKRWDPDTTVGRPEIMKFVGALAGQGANKGLFITTAHFSKEARSYAQKQLTTKVVLVDGERLAKLMIEYDVGVSTQSTYAIKKIDSDFFSEEND